MEWIKTSEQLPEMEVPVLAGWFDRKGEFTYHAFMRSDSCGDGWVWAISCDNMISLGDEFIEDDDYSNITHWMPLPQPPEEG